MYNSNQIVTKLKNENNEQKIKSQILLILSQNKLSLSEARYIFDDILKNIEMNNPISL